MDQTPRQLNALIMMGIGIIMITVVGQFSPTVSQSWPPLWAGIFHMGSGIGLILLVLGIYRYVTKDPQ